MSENRAAKRLHDLIPAIIQRWDDRVRGEVSQRQGLRKSFFATASLKMLEVMAKVLGDQTDPRTAARDLAYLTVHGKERANQTTYSLEELILEFHILQEVVLEALEPDHLLDTRDRGVIIQYERRSADDTRGVPNRLRNIDTPSPASTETIGIVKRASRRFIQRTGQQKHPEGARPRPRWPRRDKRDPGWLLSGCVRFSRGPGVT